MLFQQGEWINIAGPISEEDFDLLMLGRKQKQISFSGEVLTRCNLELGDEYAAIKRRGELFVANVTDKLYLCTPVDNLVRSQKQRAGASLDPGPRSMAAATAAMEDEPSVASAEDDVARSEQA